MNSLTICLIICALTVVRQINRCFSLQIKTDILMLNAA